MSEKKPKEQLMTGARQTMGSWVKPINSSTEIPPVYQDTLHNLLESKSDWPLMVLAPPVHTEKSPSCEKLLLWLDEALYILENHEGIIKQIAFPKKDFGYLETGRVLLYSWFTITGLTTDGEVRNNTVVYNTATHRHIQPFFNALRSLSGISVPRNIHAFNYLAHRNFKFFNFAKNIFKGDEEVLITILQPEVARSTSRLLQGKKDRLVTSSHLTILTELELVFIEEDSENLQRNGNRYGGIWHYIPLENMKNITITKRQDALLTLSFKIKPDISIDRIYAEENYAKAYRLKEKLEELLKG